MKTALAIVRSIAYLCTFAIALASCAKDADLLADYVVTAETESLIIRNIVINDSYSTAEPSTMVLDVLSNDSFENLDKVKIVETSQPTNGSVTINEDKTITYTPNNIADNTVIENNSFPSEPTVDMVLDPTNEIVPKEKALEQVVPAEPEPEPEPESPKTAETPVEPKTEEPEATPIINEENATVATPAIKEAPEEKPSSDDFTYTVETTDENGEKQTQQAVVNISFEYGELRAFPGAEGFGKYAVGGRGGRTIYVTNLKDKGEGSLRHAIDQKGPRTVVFKVSGYITINSSLIIANDKITIAGQTAPGEGITVRINPVGDIACLRIKANDVIIRGMRFRPGPTAPKAVNGDAMLLTSGKRVIVDHCSFSWSTDEVLNPYGASELTFQNCIFSEALMYASHNYSTNPEASGYYRPHSMGMLIGDTSSKITIYNSVFAHNNQRNPLIGGGVSLGSEFELINNIYYNWGDFGTVISTGSKSYVNMINNLHIYGKNSRQNRYPIHLGDKVRVYGKGNINKFRENNSLPEINAFGARKAPFDIQAYSSSLVSNAFNYPLAKTALIEPSVLLPMVTNEVGAFKKDKVDRRVVADIFNGTGSLIDSPTEVGGYPSLKGGIPYLDSDKDGMSDEWENKHNLDANNADDAKKDFNKDGFTNLEDFLHHLTQVNGQNPNA